jgi:CheY-like chemotaxis protein
VAVDANDCIRSCETLLDRLIGEDIRVVQHLQPGLWAVRCDPGLVGQVIMNLAVNARDAMAGGGTLTLATENVTVEPGDEPPDPQMDPGDYVKITVKDTGTGMPREVVEHLFEPFFTTKGPGQGTGLGLPTVYGIVRQSKGFISVYSAPGAGTVFEIYLPRSDPEGQEPGEPLLVMPRGSETILVIEDDASVLATVAHGLRSAGYLVLTANGPEQALELVRNVKGPLHLVLADVVMPGQGGREVGRRIAELRPGVRVLYMSGYTQDVLDERGLLAEGEAVLPKPFTKPELVARVREVLDWGSGVELPDP